MASYDSTPVPTSRQRHMLTRMGCGFSVSSFADLRRAGGELEWFEQQLYPESVTETATGSAIASWFPRLQDSPKTIWDNNERGVKAAWEYARDLSNYSLLRRIHSRRTVFESMVDFWSNHLHVDANHFPGFTQRAAYDAVMRTHALGRFDELLVAATLHPAMLMYLDNWKSVRGAPNENHGREVLELHTVGRDAGYTEAMVKDSAKILSGYTVIDGRNAGADGWTGYYDASRHTTGAVSVLGFTAANTSADGSRPTVDYLRFLAHHPSTAQRIARKLAVRFVSDAPSEALVAHVAGVFLESGTDVKATLRALVATEEFWGSAGDKVRTVIDDVVATCRALRVKAQAPVDLRSFANELSWALDSTLPFQWPRPDGPPERATAWASPTRMLNSWRMHWNLAGGYWPDDQVRFKRPVAYLPQDRLRFDRFVDHVCRVVLGRPSNTRLLDAACEGTGTGPGEVVTAGHPIIEWKMHRLLSVLLDTPAHMSR